MTNTRLQIQSVAKRLSPCYKFFWPPLNIYLISVDVLARRKLVLPQTASAMTPVDRQRCASTAMGMAMRRRPLSPTHTACATHVGGMSGGGLIFCPFSPPLSGCLSLRMCGSFFGSPTRVKSLLRCHVGGDVVAPRLC